MSLLFNIHTGLSHPIDICLDEYLPIVHFREKFSLREKDAGYYVIDKWHRKNYNSHSVLATKNFYLSMKGPLASSEDMALLILFCRVMFSPSLVILDLFKDTPTPATHPPCSLFPDILSASVRVRPTKWVLSKGVEYQEM